MASDYSEFKAAIKTVDSQDSLGGGVLVLVTGSLSTKLNGRRDFVQSFFLAPQEKGYFVLNDIFRYLDDEVQHLKSAPVSMPSSTDGAIETPAVSQPGAKAGKEMNVIILLPLFPLRFIRKYSIKLLLLPCSCGGRGTGPRARGSEGSYTSCRGG